MYNSKYYKTWKQAFAEVNAQALKHEIIKAIASEVVGRPVENLVGFTNEQRDMVWNDYYNTTALCEN
jgi:hypothetical protein